MDTARPTRYDVDEDEAFSEAIVRAVATEKGVDPTVITPLFDVVDPDALDRVMDSLRTDPGRDGGHVSFSYGAYTVTADSRGYLELLAQ